MNKLKNRNCDNQRLFTIDEACAYLSGGKNSTRKWLDEIGATKHLGIKTVRFDRNIIDKALDDMEG